MTPQRMNQILRGLLAVLIMSTIGGLYLANQRLGTVAQDTAKLKADVAIADSQLKNYQQNQKQVDSLSYVNDLANTVLPPNADQSTVVTELSEFASRAGLTVSQIAFATPTKTTSTSSATKNAALAVPKGVQVLPVTIQLKAGSRYADLLTFLKTVESNRRKSQVTNVTLTPDTKDRAVLSQVSITLNLYTQQPKATK